MPYAIRKATKNDAENLIKLSKETINHNFRSFMGNEPVDDFLNSGMADSEITDNIGNTVVLICCGKVIGLCIWKENLLHLMMIAPAYQGTGASKYFIDIMCHEKFKEYKELVLECFEENKRANAFYRKCDWAIYKTEVDGGTGWTRLCYRKEEVTNEN